MKKKIAHSLLKKATPTLSFNSPCFSKIEKEIGKVFIGQKEILCQIVIVLLSEGHILLNGLPGLAKTLLVKSLAQLFSFSYNRLQFTPDLLPSDLIGYEVIGMGEEKNKMKFIEGPIFAQILLADEINRAPAKTQSALLQAMEEKRATVLGKEHKLPSPFLVLATQNPLEEKGTYELPEAQLDRFMAQINITYPDYADEVKLVSLSLTPSEAKLTSLFDIEDYKKIRKEIKEVKIAKEALEWVVRLVRATRPHGSDNDKVKQYLRVGASPRATKSLVESARATAYLNNAKYVEKKHIEFVLPMIMQHRLRLSYEAEMDKVDLEALLMELVREIKS